MDVKKAGEFIAAGDLEGFMSLCDETEQVNMTSGSAATLIVGRMGTLVIEFMSDGAGRDHLEAHAHPNTAISGACFAETALQVRESAAEVNRIMNMVVGHDVTTVSGGTPDYIPGSWMTV